MCLFELLLENLLYFNFHVPHLTHDPRRLYFFFDGNQKCGQNIFKFVLLMKWVKMFFKFFLFISKLSAFSAWIPSRRSSLSSHSLFDLHFLFSLAQDYREAFASIRADADLIRFLISTCSSQDGDAKEEKQTKKETREEDAQERQSPHGETAQESSETKKSRCRHTSMVDTFGHGSI
jgi:hypothetical protein